MSCMWSIYSIKRTAEKNGVAPCLTGEIKSRLSTVWYQRLYTVRSSHHYCVREVSRNRVEPGTALKRVQRWRTREGLAVRISKNISNSVQ